ncbi:zinc metalloprotease [Flavobacterium psychrophilum]|nr:hypothetical protein [Flavobacterium psychrophilum]MCB6088975.1 hypothetical protein [Flavobacterium psychrophilum]
MIYILLFAILILHEIGHSIFAKQYNIGTGKIGLGLYLFIIPVFYINLNEIWRLKNEKRIIINLGGIFFQLLAGIILVFIYQINQSDVLASLIKINLVIAMLNFNPFIKFDGYWALSDLLNNKDLYSQSNTAIKKWFNFKSHQYSKVITFYSIGRIIFYTFISYILINSIVIFLLSLWN